MSDKFNNSKNRIGTFRYLQYVANDSHRPHVRFQADRLEAHDFGRNKFRRSTENSNRFPRSDPLRQSEIDNLDIMRGPRLTHDILWLHSNEKR